MNEAEFRPDYIGKYLCESNRRKNVMVTMRPDLYKISREYGINLSKLLETALIQTLEPQNEPFSLSTGSLFGKRESVWCSGRDLNPGLRLESTFFSEKKLHQENCFGLKWLEHKERFEQWLESEGYSQYFKADVLSYLRRYVVEIGEPFDIIALFSKVNRGKRHLVMALRTLFNFYEAVGVNKDFLDSLRKPLPKVQSGIDLKIPEEAKIIESLKKLSKAPVKYQALFNLLLDSGLRLVEAVELINTFKEAEAVNGFYRCEVAMFRGEKQAYYGHFSKHTYDLISQVKEKIKPIAASRYYRKMRYVLPKYLRKYAFDKMIELEVPESVADFIEGRVPKRIGAKHYLALARQSSKFYPRYMEYIERLRQQT